MELGTNMTWVWLLHTEIFEGPIASLNINNSPISIMGSECVFCDVGTEFFYVGSHEHQFSLWLSKL
jgi:hypothetical protein